MTLAGGVRDGEVRKRYCGGEVGEGKVGEGKKRDERSEYESN